DVALRADTGMFGSSEAADREIQFREAERTALIAALADQKLTLKPPPAETPTAMNALTLSVLRYAARAPSALLMVNTGDMLMETTQINLPGTVNEHPNWRQRMTISATELADHPLIRAGAAEIRKER
ncbi:MAG: 4-alpha-glucanotransferase, partial [Rhodospirillaceae bacterium]|nr:4-alpha-glucanotransferase [Rhodospirillaceae bacterium]